MNNKVCIDASLALTWLLPAQQNEAANALQRRWVAEGVELLSAPLFHAEVTSVIREQVYFKWLLPEEGDEAFSIYLDVGVRTMNSPDVQKKAWALAKKFNLPRTYDMQYLAVAELEDCEFWTSDKALVNSLKGKVKRIKWVGQYRERE